MIFERPAFRLSQLRAASPNIATGFFTHAQKLAHAHLNAQRSFLNRAADGAATRRRVAPPTPFRASFPSFRRRADRAPPVAAASSSEHQTRRTNQHHSFTEQDTQLELQASQRAPGDTSRPVKLQAQQSTPPPPPPPPPPDPIPPLFTYLQSLLVEPFDILMGNATGKVDYISTDMHVRCGSRPPPVLPLNSIVSGALRSR